MTVNTLTLYMPGSSVGIQVWEGSQLHEILVAQGASFTPSAPFATPRADPFPQYVDNDELAAILAGFSGGGGGGAVDSVNGQTGVVVLGAADIGLDDVDNTPDASKPVSTDQQTALDAKASRLVTINAQAGSYTLALADANDVAVHMTSASAVALTYPPNSAVAIPIGASGVWFAAGAGQVTHTPGAGVTLQAQGGGLKSGGQFSEGTWRKVATSTFVVSGLLTT